MTSSVAVRVPLAPQRTLTKVALTTLGLDCREQGPEGRRGLSSEGLRPHLDLPRKGLLATERGGKDLTHTPSPFFTHTQCHRLSQLFPCQPVFRIPHTRPSSLIGSLGSIKPRRFCLTCASGGVTHI